MKKVLFIIVFILVSLSVVSCSGNDADGADAEISIIGLSQTNITLYVGQTHRISAAILPNDAVNKELTWKSSHSNVATVSDGLIQAKAPGITVITAKSSNGKSASLKLEVKPFESIKTFYMSKQNISLAIGETLSLNVYARPASDSSDFPVVWSSSDGMIASVDDNGMIVAKGEGGCFIYAEIAGVTRAISKVEVNGISPDLSAIADMTVENLPISIENKDFVLSEETQAFQEAVILKADLLSYEIIRELTADGVTITLLVTGVKTYDIYGEDSTKAISAKMLLYKEDDELCDDPITLISNECRVGEEFTLKFMFNAKIALFQRSFYAVFDF